MADHKPPRTDVPPGTTTEDGWIMGDDGEWQRNSGGSGSGSGGEEDFSALMMEMMGMLGTPTPVDYEAQADAAIRMAWSNIGRFPAIAGMANRQAMKYVPQWDQYAADRYYSDLAKKLPTWQEDVIGTQVDVLHDVNAIADEYLSGELPKDVADEIARTRAELGISQGLFGDANTYATARDLGLTSLQMVEKGIGYKTDAGVLAQRLLGSVQSIQPPTYDPGAIYGANLSALAGAGTINPTAAMETSANIAIANSEAAWSAKLSAANMAMTMYTADQNAALMTAQIAASKKNAEMAMWGQIIGGATQGGSAVVTGGIIKGL